MKAADAEGAIETLQKEKAWLLEQKRTAETGILHLQKSGVDLSSKLEILQKEHKKVLDELSFERDRVKVFLLFGQYMFTCSCVYYVQCSHVAYKGLAQEVHSPGCSQ